MKDKGSVLMISMWIVVILAMMAVGLGWRASINLKMSGMQRDRMKAYFLAKAGLQRAILELESDKNDFDSLNETWSSGKDHMGKSVFENIGIGEGPGGSFSVGIIDEDSRINVNTAPALLITALLKECGISSEEANGLSEYICLWRGDDNPGYKKEAQPVLFKRSPLMNKAELSAAFECFYERSGRDDYLLQAKALYAKLKDLITVYPAKGEAKVNINTVSAAALKPLIDRALASLRAEGQDISFDPSTLREKILEHREDNNFSDTKLREAIDISGPDETACEMILSKLEESIKTRSREFLITVRAEAAKAGATRLIKCVYDREDDKVVYWSQN
ncbi:MAG: type II secretion system protein GspK [Candidatus Omnitrophica bacterium]|nr:type II secretion system protein GspK [Candidatus Omnitrophota bacterium]MDD5552680.1 type II secretion system protein GspK [Candidatus Omnitrophota bacterium]